MEAKPKLEGKRSTSHNISFKFILAQRLVDKVTSLSMLIIMVEIANCLFCGLKSYNSYKNNKIYMLYLIVTAIDKLKIVIGYFNKYPLLGIIGKNFND